MNGYYLILITMKKITASYLQIAIKHGSLEQFGIIRLLKEIFN